jgi:hypothetical protein
MTRLEITMPINWDANVNWPGAEYVHAVCGSMFGPIPDPLHGAGTRVFQVCFPHAPRDGKIRAGSKPDPESIEVRRFERSQEVVWS